MRIEELFLIVVSIFFFNIKLGLVVAILFGLMYCLHFKHNLTNNININKNNNLDNFKENKCRKPTMNNPYGNYNMGENPDLQSCDNDDDNLTKKKFNEFNVYENSNENTVGSSNKLMRDFYTTPITEYPNNSTKFAYWLYRDVNLTCKNDNNCFLFDDIRFHSR